MRFVVGIVVVFRGLVHLLYVAQSRRLFELQPGMLWPDGSWAFSGLLLGQAGLQAALAEGREMGLDETLSVILGT